MSCFLGFNCCVVGALGKAVGCSGKWRMWGKGKRSHKNAAALQFRFEHLTASITH